MDIDLLKARRRFFVTVWAFLAEEGACDALYGVEFKRVIVEWFDAGAPEDVAAFIRTRANVSPAAES